MREKKVKRWWLLCVVVAVLSNGAVAQRVSRETAQSVAETFFNNNLREGQDQSVQFKDITAETPFQNFYIFSADSGFVIVAGDERVTPILGYSKTSRFVTEDMPENLRWWLEGYEEQIQYAIDNQLPPSEKDARQWNDLKTGQRGVMQTRVTVGPLTETLWGQQGRTNGSSGDPIDLYNQQCPEISGAHCLPGCTAIAMAQVMRYWQHPTYPHGTKPPYIPSNPKHLELYPRSVNFDTCSYDWSKMPVILSASTSQDTVDEVAQFIYQCAVSISSNFGVSGTDATLLSVASALTDYFYYKPTSSHKFRASFSDATWKQMLKNDLSASPGRPVCYRGQYYDNENNRHAHAWVCDGYEEVGENDYFHFNFGWYGGSYQSGEPYNNYYSIDPVNKYLVLQYIDNQAAIFGIEPDEAVVSATVSPNVGGTVTGTGTYRKGNMCTLTATPSENYVFVNWTKNGEVISNEEEISFILTEDVSFVANFQKYICEINTEAFPIVGGTASGEGTFLLGDTCTVTATPNLGFAFIGWFNGLMTFSYSDQPEYTFTVTEDKTLVARFVPRNYTVTTMCQPSTGGSVSGNQGSYPAGGTVTLTASANPGYVFNGWMENGQVVCNTSTYTFQALSNRNLSATFVSTEFAIGSLVTNPDGSQGVVFYVDPSGTEGWMVALNDASEGCAWGEATNVLPLLEVPYNSPIALSDLSGYRNTGIIRSVQGTENEYAASLVDYANGWYLPSVGQLRKLYAALPFIESAITAAGGTTLTEDTYWSSTEFSTSDASTPMFALGNTNKTANCRVRAIRNFVTAGNNVVLVTSNDNSMGTASVYGNGTFAYGDTVTVSATPNAGFTFDHWSEDGVAVSCDPEYQFTFTRSCSLVAYFVVPCSVGNIVNNADGSRGVVFWLSPDGEEGLMVALEDASEGCQWGEATDALTLLNQPYNNSLALRDVSGNTNTRCIRNHQGVENNYAASLVDFENGWYLPSVGELRKLYGALPMIEAALVDAGGSTLTEGTYWSSTEYSGSDAATATFSIGNTNKTNICRVRAIRHFAASGPNAIMVKSNNLDYGNVTGSGEYSYGQDVTVTAIPNSGYTFNAWTENGMIVSYDATYHFTFTRSRSLVANFVLPNSIGNIVTNADGSRGVVFYTYPSGMGGLVVALEDVSEGCPWGLNEDITILDNQSPSAVIDLLNDMNGRSNTNKIREWYSGNTNYAACKTDLENGWYLPSTGQLRKLYAALPMIESVIINACGSMMTEGTYWSSTEQSASKAWTPMFAMGSTSKTSNCRVRAIRSLLIPHTINAMVNLEGSGTVSGAGVYDHGQTCTLKAVANPSYAFLYWKKDGVVVSTDMEYSFTVLGNHTYVAHFAANSCNITTAFEPAGAGTVSGAGVYSIGATCTLTATTNPGYTFYSWTSGGYEVSTSPTFSFTVTESALYYAHFVINSYYVEATANPEEGGTITGSHAYTYGSTATLTALPEEGYTFINWKENGVVVSTSPTYQFVVTGNRTLQANFSNNAYTVTAIAYPSDGGTIEGAGAYDYGTTATLTAHANNGYEFYCWFEDDDIVSFDPSLSFEVTEDVVVYAVFDEITFAIQVTVNPENGGIVNGGGTYSYGDNCTLTATANEDYTFVNWTENGEVVSTDAEYSFTVTGNRNLDANFGQNTYTISASAIPSNGGSVSGAGNYNYGETCTLTATANTGYNFVRWTKNGTQVSTNPSYSFTVTENANCVAYFRANSYTISASANPTEGGTVSGEGTYNHGTTCTLTATANEDYTFVNWTENGEVVSTDTEYSFTVTGNRNLVANFTSDSGGYYWTVNINQYPNTMTAIGVILINDVEQMTNTLELGAFCGTECRGRERLAYISQMDRYLLFLTMYGENGDVLNFRLYDHALGQELDVICTNSVTFATNSTLGTVVSPYEFSFMEGIQTQTSSLPEGWSWWSTYIEQEGIDGLTQLENSLGENGVMIKSQSEGFTSRYGDYWFGLLNSINNESSYLVQTSGSCDVSLTGHVAVPSEHPITLLPGWTWIGYPNNTAMSVSTALSNLNPSENDMLKAQESFSVYYPGIGWFGSLQTIMPGMGLMYESHNTSSVTLTYSNPTRTDDLAENVTARANHWNPDVYAYPNNMNVMAVVEVNGEELQSEDYELAAFANGECRGSAKLMYVEQLHRHMAFLTLHGDDETELSFGLYDNATGMTAYKSDERLIFAANAVVGSPDNPMVVSFSDITGIDSFGGTLHVFPNPVERGSMITIGTVEESDEVRVEIMNTVGAVLFTETSTKLPANIKAPEVPGVYMLRITSKGRGIRYVKLIVS